MKNFLRFRILLAVAAVAVAAIVSSAIVWFEGPSAIPRPANVIAVYNILDYGAKCDGSTNDLAAINAAVAQACAAPGSILYTPPSANGCIVGQTAGSNFSVNLSCGDITIQGARGSSFWKQTTGLPSSQVVLLQIQSKDLVTIDGMGFSGNWGNAATLISESSINQTLTGTYTLHVVSTTGFPAGAITINVQSTIGNNIVACTGSTATTFTSCTGGSGIVMPNYTVGYVDAITGINQGTQATPANHLVNAIGATNLTIKNSLFEQAYGAGVNIANDPANVSAFATNVKILNNYFFMAAGAGMQFGGAAVNALIEGNVALYTFGPDVAVAAGNYSARSGVVRANVLTGWWDPTAVSLLPLSLTGGVGGYALPGASDVGWRIEHNTINGPILLSAVWNAAVTDNNIVVDCGSNVTTGIQAAPLTVENGGGQVTIVGNTIYTRAPANVTDGDPSSGGISVVNTAGSGSIYYNPVTVTIADNTIQVENGHHGITLVSPGGNVQNTTGTATGTAATSLTVSGTPWTVNQFEGQTVRAGTAQAVIASNTSSVLTLSLVDASTTTAWQNTTGAYAPTPSSTSTFTISRATGVVDIHDNQINLKDDGNGGGSNGIHLTGAGTFPGGRVRIHDNEIVDGNPSGIDVEFNASNVYPIVDVFRNYGYDDQAAPTMTNLVEFDNAPNAGIFILSDNILGEGVTNEITGLSSGQWLLHDGNVPEWAGFGSPAGVIAAPVSSTYHQVDGTGASITWTKESGTGTSGWLADALQGTSPTFTGATIGSQIISTNAPSVNNGSLGTGSTNWLGNVTGIGATSTTLTFGGAPFATSSWCLALPNSAVLPEVIYVTLSRTAPVFNCINTTTGGAVNCDDFTYECSGQ